MVAIVAVQNTAVTANPDGSWRITKTGGFDEAFDAPAVSVAAIAGDFVLRGRRVGAADRLMIGVTADPAEDTGYIGIDYAVAWRGNVVEVFERGDYRTYSFVEDAPVWIERVGTTLRYRYGRRRREATLLRSVSGVGGPLFFDSSLVTPGCAVDVRFAAPGAWCDPKPGGGRAGLGPALAL